MRRAQALHTHGAVSGASGVEILKVLEADEAHRGAFPLEHVLLWNADASDGFAGSVSESDNARQGRVRVHALRDVGVIRPGDVVRVREKSSLISVLYRRGASSNSLFITERCNSLCLMCSQPPRNEDDSWRIAELEATIDLVDVEEKQLGFTGGEPTLLGRELGGLLERCRRRLPDTGLHVLTNGRSFKDAELARDLVSAGGDRTVWAVPLYADVASIHDETVQALGAFEETMAGLFELALRRAHVEIRIVLHAMSVSRLRQLASLIYRRLPFVEHVAFMGLEPMGLAKVNRDRLWIDPVDYAPILQEAVHHVAVRGLPTSIYNLPFCTLPRDLWPFARKSISDWKNVMDPACAGCALQDRCAGFFISAGPSWRSRAIAPIQAEEAVHELA